MALPDIETREDIERLVRAFYGRAMSDEIIGFIFTDVAKLDLEAHVPEITAFWETVLLDAKSYNRSAFEPHAALNTKVTLRAGHFERWLGLWGETIDELFAGERATAAKAHAMRVAYAFHGRLRTLEPPAAAGGLVVTRHGPGQP
ncbi:MAG: group III truncated hemoglobin [Solirubrobacteraceae bacterium]